MSEIAMRKWIAKAAIGHRDEYGRQLYRVMQESSPKPTTRILTAVGKKGLFSKEEAELIASMPVLHGQVLPMLADQVLTMKDALMEITAITTAEGTEAEDMAAQIQGAIRKAISMQSNLSETPQKGQGAQDLARDIVRSLGITNASDKDQNLAKQVQILREALSDNLQAWEGEEESVREEHAELIDETRAALEATKGEWMNVSALGNRNWLWPDHVAGKRETRRLREEHNKLAREHHELRIAMDEIHRMASVRGRWLNDDNECVSAEGHDEHEEDFAPEERAEWTPYELEEQNNTLESIAERALQALEATKGPE